MDKLGCWFFDVRLPQSMNSDDREQSIRNVGEPTHAYHSRSAIEGKFAISCPVCPPVSEMQSIRHIIPAEMVTSIHAMPRFVFVRHVFFPTSRSTIVGNVRLRQPLPEARQRRSSDRIGPAVVWRFPGNRPTCSDLRGVPCHGLRRVNASSLNNNANLILHAAISTNLSGDLLSLLLRRKNICEVWLNGIFRQWFVLRVLRARGVPESFFSSGWRSDTKKARRMEHWNEGK